MGIRIVKAVGYGLTGLSIDPENYMQTNDQLLNINSPVFADGQEDRYTDASYIEHLRSKTAGLGSEDFFHSPDFGLIFPLRALEKELTEEERSTSFTMMSHIIYDGEYGDPGTLLIIPPGMKDSWIRHGDHIDGLESFLEDEDCTDPKIQVMNFSPYPFDGLMDARTGEKIPDKIERKLRSIRTLEKALRTREMSDKDREEIARGAEILQADAVNEFGFETYGELIENIVPLVPVEVKDFVQWAGIFSDAEGWKNLRPMLYTYWS